MLKVLRHPSAQLAGVKPGGHTRELPLDSGQFSGDALLTGVIATPGWAAEMLEGDAWNSAPSMQWAGCASADA